jgi:hypothetical protein
MKPSAFNTRSVYLDALFVGTPTASAAEQSRKKLRRQPTLQINGLRV